MGTSFNEQFGQHGAWRRGFARRLRQLSEWMESRDLVDAAVQERLLLLEEQVRTDKVMVAFVAEFSRGKSELINAIFFADYGRRIMPASAGRTTMCPSELGYDPHLAPSVRLLPVQTRQQINTLAEWRLRPEAWEEVALDVNDPSQLAQALAQVSQVIRVPLKQAQALGLWLDESPEEVPPAGADGLVEIPKWRHAIINFPHPLLKQGLVILDTPGLNAVGAEPELTLSLIPQAHAVVFILGADTGVTRSDLSIWREHLASSAMNEEACLVVLNKIDTLWDTLSTPEDIQAQLMRQCMGSAQILQVPVDRVLPVSAQKGLVGKIQGDTDLLDRSGLQALEDALAAAVMSRRQKILRAVVGSGVAGLSAEAARVIRMRRRDMDDQMAELRSLRGKNANVIQAMRQRVEQEQHEFDVSTAKVQAVKSVHLKLLDEVFQQLGTKSLKAEMSELAQALQHKGFKVGVRKMYQHTFNALRSTLDKAQASATEIQAMLEGTFRQLNADFGFSLKVAPLPALDKFVLELNQIEDNHLQYFGFSNALKLARPEFAERLVRALQVRVRTVYESAANDLELWSKSATAQLDSQLRDRRRSFARRLEAVDRIQQAAGGLVERIAEIEGADQELQDVEQQLRTMASQLVDDSGGAAPLPSADRSLDLEIV